jgi:hypothetical protein
MRDDRNDLLGRVLASGVDIILGCALQPTVVWHRVAMRARADGRRAARVEAESVAHLAAP